MAIGTPAVPSSGGAGSAVSITGPLGSKSSAQSVSVVIASDQGAIPITGSITATNPSVSATGSGVPASGTYIAVSKAGTLTGILLGSQTSANSLAVVIASDQASIPVAATLNAETTKVIGVTRTADGAGNLLTSTANALDVNIKTGNPTTMTVTQGTGTNLHTVVDSGTITTVSTVTNLAQMNGVTLLMGNGTTGTGSQRVTIASDNTAFAVNATLSAETTKVIGTVNISAAQTVAAVTAITNALPAGTNNIGQVTPVPTSNTGWSFFYNAGGISSTKLQLKATAGTFGGWAWLYNPNTAATFIQVFNKASASVTVGTTAPDFVIVLPGIASASATGSAANAEIVMGIAMSTGITVAATTTETGSTAPSNTIFATFLFK